MNYRFKGFVEQSCLILTDFSESNFTKALNTDNYKILWARTDPVMITIDGYHMSIKKNQLLFCTPLNTVHIEEPFEGLSAFIFNREFYCIRDHDKEVACDGLLFLGSSVPPIITLDKKEQRSYNVLYMMFEEEFLNKDHIQGEMLRVLLKRLLIKSVRLIKNDMPKIDLFDKKLEVIRQFNLLVEKHFKQTHKVSEYANMLVISPKSLSNIFSKFNYKSPLKVINERLQLEAERLLQFSNKNINEISFELGFSTMSHFSKFFKKNNGNSPTFYREDLTHFYDKCLNLFDVKIFMAGNVGKNEVKLINDIFGQHSITHDEAAGNVFSVETDANKKHNFINDENGVQGAIRIASMFPNRKHEDYAPLVLLNTVFGGYFGSRLMSNIREDKGFTYGIYSGMTPMRNAGTVTIQTEVGRKVIEDAVREIYNEMERITNDKVGDDELLLVKNYLLGNLLGDLDGPFQIIQRWRTLIANDMDITDFDKNVQIYKSTDANTLRDLAQKYYNKENFHEVVVV